MYNLVIVRCPKTALISSYAYLPDGLVIQTETVLGHSGIPLRLLEKYEHIVAFLSTADAMHCLFAEGLSKTKKR